MNTVYFVRHAEPNYQNHDDMTRELTEKGLADRRLVTDFLSGRQIDAVFSSPYRRAVDTISPFAEAAGLAITSVEDFRERKVGTGWIEDFHEYSLRQWADFAYKLPEGESLREVQERNIRALRRVLKGLQPGQNAVVGSHGTALSTVIHLYQPDFGCEEFYRLGKLPWIVEFAFENERCTRITSYDLFSSAAEQLL